MHRVKYQIHYPSPEEVIKNIHDKQFTTVTTHKKIQYYYNEKYTYNVTEICYTH